MKLPLVIILAILSPFYAFSQDFELAGIRYLHYPTSKTNNNDEFSINEFGVFFNIPTTIKKDKTIMINGFDYGQVRINHLDNPISVFEKNTVLHFISYRFIMMHKFNQKWSIIGVLEPSLASDFESPLSNDDLIIQSTVLITKTFNSKLSLGAGLAYTTRFGSPLVIPMVPIEYKTNRHRINALLPLNVLYTYELNQNLDIGFKALINGASFNITGYNNDIAEISKINYTRANLGPALYYRPIETISIELTAGISTNREFRLIDVNNSTYENPSSTAAFFNIGLVIKPPKKE
ncbi:MAG: hypothetical protein ACI83B_003832 [Sediminicola sp.]|jgi:hypothetical protein